MVLGARISRCFSEEKLEPLFFNFEKKELSLSCAQVTYVVVVNAVVVVNVVGSMVVVDSSVSTHSQSRIT